MLFDELGAEAVVAGGDGCVRGEDDLAGDLTGGVVEVHAFFEHASANGLEDCEAAVAFVEVKDSGSDAHGLEGAEAAYAEEELLTDAGAAVSAVEARGEFEVFGGVAGDVGVEKEKVAAADFDSPDLGADGAAAGLDFDDDGLAVFADGGLHGELVDVGLEVVFELPSGVVEALEEVSLAVEEADADEWDVEVGCALDVIAGEDAEASGVDGEGFVQAEFGGEVGYWARTQDACVGCAPGAVGLQVLLLAAVGVVDASVQHQLCGATLDLVQRHFVEKRDWVLVRLAPACGAEVAKEADAVVVPTPPEIAGEGPEALLRRGDEAIEGAGFADDGRDLVGSLDQHADLSFAKGAWLFGLHDENALEDSAVDERNTQEGMICLFAGFFEVLEARVIGCVLDGYGSYLFGDQAGEAFVESEAQRADAAWMEAEGRGQDEVGAVGFEEVG